MRRWLADRMSALAMWLWERSERVRPADTQPRCPDCRIGPDVAPDECPICRDAWEQQQRDKEIYGAGFEDGHRAGAMDNEQTYHEGWG